MLNVVCLKLGDKFSAEYVNKLYSMVSRHMQDVEHTFWCITDDSTGIDGAVRISNSFSGLEGWWGKLQVFEKGLLPEDEYILFLDLDSIIVGELFELVEYGKERLESERMVIMEDFNRPFGYGSAVFMIKADGGLHYVYERFLENKVSIMREHHGDQEYFEVVVPDAAIWPRAWMLSYKVDSELLKNIVVPKSAKIICFHGPPKNHEVLNDPLVAALWR